MVIFLETLFDEFCKYLDGKLKWSERETKPKMWTKIIFNFFTQRNEKEAIPFLEKKEYMRVDYIWRYDTSRYSTNDIELAVEPENMMEKVDILINEEIQHLIDIKARNKIGIFYVSHGDEKEFIRKVQERIKTQIIRSPIERYLIILGYTTTHHKKRAILFKGFFFDQDGNLTSRKENIILQAR